MKPIKSWLQLGVLAGIALLGTAMFFAGYYLETYESPQIRYYNEGRVLFEKAKMDPKALDEAMLAFDKSLDAYRAEENRGFIQSLIYPPRSSEVAALTLSKKAILYLYKQKAEDAVKTFKEAISLNPGNFHAELIALTMPGENLSSADIARLADQAYVAIHNLEMLFSKSPQLQQAQGSESKGEGRDPEQAPGSKPSPGAGKVDDPNAL